MAATLAVIVVAAAPGVTAVGAAAEDPLLESVSFNKEVPAAGPEALSSSVEVAKVLPVVVEGSSRSEDPGVAAAVAALEVPSSFQEGAVASRRLL